MDNKLRCALCLHQSEPFDPVALYHVGGKGDVARCVSDDNCQERQVNARKIDRDKKTLAATR